ncbi:hypothetical protein GH733_004046 [Mirounga leonina]|nr:hypothetical protein GH733_004046 [Mirounga leonina]
MHYVSAPWHCCVSRMQDGTSLDHQLSVSTVVLTRDFNRPWGFSVPGEIIGGTECKPHSRPYMAHLEIITPQNHLMSCGGFLIRWNFVLTAAHSIPEGPGNVPVPRVKPELPNATSSPGKGGWVESSNPHDRLQFPFLRVGTSQETVDHHCLSLSFLLPHHRFIMVTLGAHNIRKKEDTWQKLEVIKQFPHPKYDDFTIRHDIMLLKLKKKANLTLAVGTLPLPPQFNFIPPWRMCRVAGWGRRQVNGAGSDTLQEVKLRLMDPQACRHYLAFDHNPQLCVGNPRKTKTAFKGDSGGPLLCAGVAQGIVSYGQDNAKPPAVFTRISHYRPWINEVLKQN